MPPNTEEDKARGLSPYDFKRLLRAVLGGGSDISADNPLEVHDPKVSSQTDKLAGETPVSDSVTANWNTATGTSGEAGEDLVTIGSDGTKYKLHSFLINISALTGGAIVTVKLFMKVKGTERKVYSQDFTKGTDPDGLWIVNGTVGIHEALRCEVYSNISESKAIDYDYMLEAM